jgi:hypothetical protein
MIDIWTALAADKQVRLHKGYEKTVRVFVAGNDLEYTFQHDLDRRLL